MLGHELDQNYAKCMNIFWPAGLPGLKHNHDHDLINLVKVNFYIFHPFCSWQSYLLLRPSLTSTPNISLDRVDHLDQDFSLKVNNIALHRTYAIKRRWEFQCNKLFFRSFYNFKGTPRQLGILELIVRANYKKGLNHFFMRIILFVDFLDDDDDSNM